MSFIGYNSSHKGTALLQGVITACAADPVAFVAKGDIGKVAEDRQSIVTTGQHRRKEATELIKRYLVDVVIVASTWPETFSYTLSEAWMAVVPVIVGPLGAPAERVDATGAGLVMPGYRVQTYVAALRGLMNDQDQLAQLKRAAAAVSPQQDYDDYRDLYRQHAHRAPTPTHFFSSSVEQAARQSGMDVSQVPVIARLVEIRERVFPVGTTRERMYFWMHNRISRVYAGGTTR